MTFIGYFSSAIADRPCEYVTCCQLKSYQLLHNCTSEKPCNKCMTLRVTGHSSEIPLSSFSHSRDMTGPQNLHDPYHIHLGKEDPKHKIGVTWLTGIMNSSDMASYLLNIIKFLYPTLGVTPMELHDITNLESLVKLFGACLAF